MYGSAIKTKVLKNAPQKKEKCPAQPDALKFLFLAVQAAGYTVHAEFVQCHTNGTARRGARAFCVACRRRMCYADIQQSQLQDAFMHWPQRVQWSYQDHPLFEFDNFNLKYFWVTF